jgi:hypothetical protein
LRTSRKVALGVALAAALPAVGQDRPESILPPGFGQPQPTPTAEPTARVPTPAPSGAVVQPLPAPEPSASASASASPTATPSPIDPATLAFYELPPFARRSLDRVGPVRSSEGGFPPDAWGRSDGQYLQTLMRRLSAPLPSRWLSILLRRALLTEADTPRNAQGADFAAERAWLLLRMGESVGARAVVQSVDNADYTPKLYQVALNAMLATGDPGGLCPHADRALDVTGERGWTLARAMCAGLSGLPQQASAMVRDARRRGVARGVDLLLAEKVVGAGGGGRQAVTIEWAGVDRLTPWRFGLATATGVAVPEDLVASTGRQVRYWQALAPGIAPAARVRAAEAAAAQGVLSSAALVDLYGVLLASDDEEEVEAADEAAARDLATAFADPNVDTRLAALGRLWGEDPPYARLVLTARPAAGIVPTKERAGEADRLVASMLTAGLARPALRWRSVSETGGDAWAMLTLVDPRAGPLGYSALASYAGRGDTQLKQRLFFAGLAGLGGMTREDIERGAEAFEVPIGATNSWTRAIDRAAAAGETGTVVLLSATAMQTPAWRGVPPAMLFRIVTALRAVGLEGEARMIAAEAIARA